MYVILAQNLRLLRRRSRRPASRDTSPSLDVVHPRWSQETLGFEAGLHRTYISQIEKGKSNVSIDNIEKLAHALGLTVSDLLRPLTGENTFSALLRPTNKKKPEP